MKLMSIVSLTLLIYLTKASTDSKMSQPIPTISWLTESFLEEILKNFLKLDDIKIKTFKVAPCNSHGEGFLSLLLRVTITYESNSGTSTIPIILKTERDESPKEDEFSLQDKEILFFDSIGGKMLEILKPFNEKVIPDVIFVDKSKQILIMEDLRVLNFTMADRLLGLDEKHAKISLQKLAKYHAASLKILRENPKAFNDFDVGVFNRNVTFIDESLKSGFKAAIDEISTWEGFEKIAEKMENLRETLIEKNLKCFDVDENDFNVLNHGDLWTTNLMFKYDGKEVVDGVLLDFQFTHFASATLDLIHFFFSSLNDEIFTPNKIEEFVQFYYKELKKVAKDLKLKVENFPSLQSFVIEFHKKLFYAFTFLTTVFPVMTSDDPDNNFQTHHSDDETARGFRKRIVKTSRYQLACERFLLYFDHFGVLEL